MIKFTNEKSKQIDIWYDDENFFSLTLISSSITNRFYIITNFIENLSNFHGKEFDDWFYNFLIEFKNSDERFDVLNNNSDIIKQFVNNYIENNEVDYSKFVDESKVKKNSIYFSINEIKMIVKMSGYLKIYSLISNTEELKFNQRLNRKGYNLLCEEVFDTQIIEKIYNIISSKTYRYKITDKYMWDYVKSIQCKSIDSYIIEIFNFIMNQILVLCEEDRNPITYFNVIVDDAVKWFLRSIYKGTIVYNDSISTEDIHSGTSPNNLRTYSYNDTIGRLKGIGYETIYNIIERKALSGFGSDYNKSLTETQNRISSIEYVSPLSECLVFPILSRATNIPYEHFKTLSAEHSAVLSYFTKTLLVKVFPNEYKSLFDLLEYYPITKPSITTTYKIKDTDYFVNLQNQVQNFFSFTTKILPYDIIRHFIGRISRVTFKHLLSGKDMVGVPLSKVEQEMVHFYTYFFADEYDEKLTEFSELLNSHF